MSTTIPMPPMKVTADELDRVERMAGKDSSVYRRLLEQRQTYKEWEAARDREAARLRQAREAREAEAAAARATAREAERVAAMDALKSRLRTGFFVANPEASEDDWQRVAPRMLDAELVARAQAGRDADIEALRRSGQYGM